MTNYNNLESKIMQKTLLSVQHLKEFEIFALLIWGNLVKIGIFLTSNPSLSSLSKALGYAHLAYGIWHEIYTLFK